MFNTLIRYGNYDKHYKEPEVDELLKNLPPQLRFRRWLWSLGMFPNKVETVEEYKSRKGSITFCEYGEPNLEIDDCV